MRKCILDYSKLKATDLHAKCADVIAGCTGNTNVPALPHTVASMTTANGVLNTAMVASADKSREALSAVRDAKRVVTTMLTDTAMYVNTVCRGDETKLLSTNLTLNKIPEKRTVPEMVVNLRAMFTNNPGKISLRWSTAKMARSYNVFVSANGGTTWSMMHTTYTRRILCEALVSNTRYTFKVVAVNQYGEAPPSDVATQLAA